MSYITFILFLVFAGLALEPEANEYTFPLSIGALTMLIAWVAVSGG
jgi:hypothetical protein